MRNSLAAPDWLLLVKLPPPTPLDDEISAEGWIGADQSGKGCL